jgi:heme/copper-type cytochrome/quinol oxidase subunit 2
MKNLLILALLPVLFVPLFGLSLSVPIVRADGPADLSNQEGFGNGGQVPQAFGSTEDATDVRTIVAKIIEAVLGLLGIVFVALLVYAGFKYMTSGGNEEQAGAAKGQIVAAVIGLVIILSAFAITIFVTNALVNAANNSPF